MAIGFQDMKIDDVPSRLRSSFPKMNFIWPETYNLNRPECIRTEEIKKKCENIRFAKFNGYLPEKTIVPYKIGSVEIDTERLYQLLSWMGDAEYSVYPVKTKPQIYFQNSQGDMALLSGLWRNTASQTETCSVSNSH